MRFSGLFSALGLSSAAVVTAMTCSVCLSGCLGGDDTSVAPPPAADAGADATTEKDAAATEKDSGGAEDASEKDAESDANPFGG
jgi:hypothetical protein